jgi:hypothetical protein
LEKVDLDKGLLEEGEIEEHSDAKEECLLVKQDNEGDVDMKDDLLDDENYFDVGDY